MEKSTLIFFSVYIIMFEDCRRVDNKKNKLLLEDFLNFRYFRYNCGDSMFRDVFKRGLQKHIKIYVQLLSPYLFITLVKEKCVMFLQSKCVCLMAG